MVGMRNLTLVVSGPRGAGKSTAVEMTLAEHPCILKGNFLSSVEGVCAQLCSSAGVRNKPDDISLEEVLTGALKESKLVLMVEVKCGVPAKFLQDLLLFAKEIGFEQNLAQIVVVLSSSRITEGLTIGTAQLRCKQLVVEDLTEAERDDYLRQVFSHFADPKVEELVESVGEAVRCRLMHLHRLYLDLNSEHLRDMDPEVIKSKICGEGNSIRTNVTL